MAFGKLIKVIVVDMQVYFNIGGQACILGFIGQVFDMVQYGKVWKGKLELCKEIGLIVMAYCNIYVMQVILVNISYMIEGFIDGLMVKCLALFNLYIICQLEYGVVDDFGVYQVKLVVEFWVYLVFRYNLDLGVKLEEVFDFSGNLDLYSNWLIYQFKYLENGCEKSMEVVMIFVDFVFIEVCFCKYFCKVLCEVWNDNMVVLADFFEMSVEEWEGKFLFIWMVD